MLLEMKFQMFQQLFVVGINFATDLHLTVKFGVKKSRLFGDKIS